MSTFIGMGVSCKTTSKTDNKEIKELNKTIEDLNKQVADLTEEKTTADKTIEDLNKQVADLTKTIEESKKNQSKE